MTLTLHIRMGVGCRIGCMVDIPDFPIVGILLEVIKGVD